MVLVDENHYISKSHALLTFHLETPGKTRLLTIVSLAARRLIMSWFHVALTKCLAATDLAYKSPRPRPGPGDNARERE